MEKDNVVRITRDYRLTVIHAIRSAVLLLLLVLAVFSVWHYRDDLNAASGRQLIAYIKSASYSDVLFEKYETDSGLSTTFAPLGVGMAVVESDYYYYVAGDGRVEFSRQLKYNSPVIESYGDWALIYDAGSTAYSVVTGYAIMKSGKADGDIIAGAVSESGSYAIVSKSSGYRSSVTVFSKKHKVLCKWETPSEYIIDVSISPKGESFKTLSLSSNGENMIFKLISRKTETGEKQYEKELNCRSVYSMKHTSSGKLMVFTDDGITVLNDKGIEKAVVPIKGETALSFSHFEQGDCLVVFKGSEINTLKAVVYDENGEVTYQEEMLGDLRDCHCRDGAVALLLESSLVWKSGSKEGRLDDISARGVLSTSDGAPVLIFTDRIERVKTE